MEMTDCVLLNYEAKMGATLWLRISRRLGGFPEVSLPAVLGELIRRAGRAPSARRHTVTSGRFAFAGFRSASLSRCSRPLATRGFLTATLLEACLEP